MIALKRFILTFSLLSFFITSGFTAEMEIGGFVISEQMQEHGVKMCGGIAASIVLGIPIHLYLRRKIKAFNDKILQVQLGDNPRKDELVKELKRKKYAFQTTSLLAHTASIGALLYMFSEVFAYSSAVFKDIHRFEHSRWSSGVSVVERRGPPFELIPDFLLAGGSDLYDSYNVNGHKLEAPFIDSNHPEGSYTEITQFLEEARFYLKGYRKKSNEVIQKYEKGGLTAPQIKILKAVLKNHVQDMETIRAKVKELQEFQQNILQKKLGQEHMQRVQDIKVLVDLVRRRVYVNLLIEKFRKNICDDEYKLAPYLTHGYEQLEFLQRERAKELEKKISKHKALLKHNQSKLICLDPKIRALIEKIHEEPVLNKVVDLLWQGKFYEVSQCRFYKSITHQTEQVIAFRSILVLIADVLPELWLNHVNEQFAEQKDKIVQLVCLGIKRLEINNHSMLREKESIEKDVILLLSEFEQDGVSWHDALDEVFRITRLLLVQDDVGLPVSLGGDDAEGKFAKAWPAHSYVRVREQVNHEFAGVAHEIAMVVTHALKRKGYLLYSEDKKKVKSTILTNLREIEQKQGFDTLVRVVEIINTFLRDRCELDENTFKKVFHEYRYIQRRACVDHSLATYSHDIAMLVGFAEKRHERSSNQYKIQEKINALLDQFSAEQKALIIQEAKRLTKKEIEEKYSDFMVNLAFSEYWPDE